MKTKLILTVILMSFVLLTGCSKNDDNGSETDDDAVVLIDPIEEFPGTVEIFNFLSNGNYSNGKIYLPESYETNHNLPTIYLIDYQEQHWEVATDEFEKVIAAVEQKPNFDALVVTLQQHLNLDTRPQQFQIFYDIFKGMTSFVDAEFTNNTSRTFIGRGSEAGIVMMSMFLEDPETSVFENFIVTDFAPSFFNEVVGLIDSGNFPQDIGNKKLHFSHSNSSSPYHYNTIINKLNEADYPWLQFESMHINDIYINAYPEAFVEGINYIFN